MSDRHDSKKCMIINLIWSGVGLVLLSVTLGLHFSDAGKDLYSDLVSTLFSQEDDTTRKLESLLKEDVRPVIHRYHERNKNELTTAISEMHRCFDGYENGIAAFVEDMDSFGTRVGILGRQLGDWYDQLWGGRNSSRVADYVRSSFEKHVFSDSRIQRDIKGILEVYGYALQANQNRMVSDIRDVVMHSGLPVDPAQLELANYNQSMLRTYQSGFKGMGQQTALDFAESLVADFFGGWVLCNYLPPQYCIPAGIVWSLLIEYWASDRIEEKLTVECKQMVLLARRAVLTDISDGLERKLMDGLHTLLEANLNTSEKIVKGSG